MSVSDEEKALMRAAIEREWEMAVRQQRLLERLKDTFGVECPCGKHIEENLYLKGAK